MTRPAPVLERKRHPTGCQARLRYEQRLGCAPSGRSTRSLPVSLLFSIRPESYGAAVPFDAAAAVTELEEVLRESKHLIRAKYPDLDASEQAIALCRSAIERYTPPGSGYRAQVANLT